MLFFIRQSCYFCLSLSASLVFASNSLGVDKPLLVSVAYDKEDTVVSDVLLYSTTVVVVFFSLRVIVLFTGLTVILSDSTAYRRYSGSFLLSVKEPYIVAETETFVPAGIPLNVMTVFVFSAMSSVWESISFSFSYL